LNLILLAIYALLLVIVAIAAFVVLGSIRTKGSVARAINMSLFLVTLPRGSGDQGSQGQKPDKELIAVMEQLYSSFSNIHAKGWNRFLYGEPYIALEMSVHHVGEEIHFYVAVPRTYEQIFEKQVHGLYASAEVTRVKDYNIFSPHGVTAGSYLKLKANPILPIKTYAHLESDPLGELVTALSKLEREGEGASIQILIRPSHQDGIRGLAQKVAREMQGGNDFKKALMLAQKAKPQKKDDKVNVSEPPKVVTAFEEETIKSLQSKASRPLFDTNIRLLVSAADEVRAKQLLNDVSSAFVQFSAPDLNSFNTINVTGSALDKLVFNFAFRIFENSQTMALSSEEISSLYHFPLATTMAPKVKYLKTRFAEPPADLPQQGIIVGMSKFRGQEREVRMTDADRRRHMYIIGQTGTGKSSFMKNLIVQDIVAGKGVCVIDPHGELAEYVMSMVPKARSEEVIYFNPGDTDRPLGLNMLEFDPQKPEQKTFITNELLSIIKSIYKDLPEAFGPMFEQYFKNSVLLLLDVFEARAKEVNYDLASIASELPTLAEIPRILTDASFRKSKLAKETNPLVKNFWEQEAEKAGGEGSLANMAPYITSKLNPFLANDYLRPIVGQPASAFNFREVIDSQKILVVNLSKGRIGDINAYLLGMIVTGKLLMAALSRVDVEDEAARKDFYLYMDEFQNFTTESIATILSEARKYRLNLIIAHQFIKQLREDIKDAVFGNVGSMVAFRVGADDAEALKTQFEPVFAPTDLMNIDNFNAHMRLLINNQSARPFNIQTIKEPDGSYQVGRALQELSRLKYGKLREDVEDDIKERYKL
jgi:type IV secretory pathway TraG/TraD family ATPase VirD4